MRFMIHLTPLGLPLTLPNPLPMLVALRPDCEVPRVLVVLLDPPAIYPVPLMPVFFPVPLPRPLVPRAPRTVVPAWRCLSPSFAAHLLSVSLLQQLSFPTLAPSTPTRFPSQRHLRLRLSNLDSVSIADYAQSVREYGSRCSRAWMPT
jgi:hypothetical protein